jgi:hypothetical protein
VRGWITGSFRTPASDELDAAEEYGEDPGAVPDGVNLMTGVHPQAFTVDQGSAQLDEWPGLTFAELVRSLERSAR